MEYIYRLHAIERMFQRDISELDVEKAVEEGDIIESYLDDKPYPSYLILHFLGTQAIHVVYAKDTDGNIVVITAYYPDPDKWKNNFKIRKV